MQPTCWDCGNNNNLSLWIRSNLYYFSCRLTGGFVEASVLFCKRQQVDFTFLPQQGVVQPSRKLSQPAFLIWRWKTLHLLNIHVHKEFVCLFLQGLSVQTALCRLQCMFMYVFCLSFIFCYLKNKRREKNSFVPESSAQSQMLKMEWGQRVRENKVNIAGLVNFGSVIKLPRQQGNLINGWEDNTFNEVRSDVDSSIVIGRGAGQRVAIAEARLAACWVYLLEIEKSWLASAGTQTHTHTSPCIKKVINMQKL